MAALELHLFNEAACMNERTETINVLTLTMAFLSLIFDLNFSLVENIESLYP